MKKYVFIIFIVLYSSSFCFAQDINLLWNARALKAVKNFTKLKEELKEKPSKKLKYEIMLEFAYAAIIAKENMVVKQTESSIFYYLVLNYGDDGLLLIAYIYDAKNLDFKGVRIESIPKNHGVYLMPNPLLSEFFGVHHNLNKNDPTVLFSKSDPFAAKVLE